MIENIIAKLANAESPTIEVIRRVSEKIKVGGRLGVFPASFNPLTVAHVEIVSQAQTHFHLDEILLLPGLANADKRAYEASLEDRVAMLLAAFEADPAISIGVASHAFFVDLTLAVKQVYDEPDLSFIAGSDTMERTLDRDGRYYQRYFKPYTDRLQALEDLFSQSRFIVAARSEFAREDLDRLFVGNERTFLDRVYYLDLSEAARRISATEVRSRVRAGLSITSLVPEVVARYLDERGLYSEGAQSMK
jgi:nicotinate-nucleotide adenylyltransferase